MTTPETDLVAYGCGAYRTACRAAPVVVPVSSTPDAADQGIPPLLTVAVGVLLILVPAAFMIVRARRNT